MRPLVSYQSLSAFTDCWQQTLSFRADVSVLPSCQHPLLTHARTPVQLWQPFDLISAVFSVSFDSLGPSARSKIMIGTSNSALIRLSPL